jgi:hypothetical protein
MASLKLKEDDELIWDCPPSVQRDWVVFWVGVLGGASAAG